MTLYEIDLAIQQFIDNMLDAVDENGELKDVDPSQLEQLQAERDQKWEAIACYFKDLTAQADAIKTEENNLKARRENLEKKAARLKELLSSSMLNAQQNKFSTARCAVSFRSSKKVIITNEDALAKDLFVIKETRDPNKKAIKALLDAGKTVDGAMLEEQQNIQIK